MLAVLGILLGLLSCSLPAGIFPKDAPLAGGAGGSGEGLASPTTDPPPVSTAHAVTSTATESPFPTAASTAAPTFTPLPSPTVTPLPPTATRVYLPPTTTSLGSGGNCAFTTNVGFEDEALALVNNERAANGLAPLAGSGSMSANARSWSQYLGCNNLFQHSSYFWGENIAGGQGSPSGVVSDWMASDGHRANILNAGYTQAGVGYVHVSGSAYGHYWTLGFNP